MRLPSTTGEERLPYGARHAIFSPPGVHFAGRLVSTEWPSRLGPRHSGQSVAPVPTTAPATSKRARQKDWCRIFGVTSPVECRLLSACCLLPSALLPWGLWLGRSTWSPPA